MWAQPGVGAYGQPAQAQQVPQLPSVQAILDEMYAMGQLMPGELDFNVQTALRGLQEAQAYEVVNKFKEANTGGIRNKSAFLSNVIKRIRDTVSVGAMGGMGGGMGMMGAGGGGLMDSKTVHIGNLPPGATPEVVRQLFSHFGAIVDVRFGGNAKYAFVDYVEPASAAAAMGMNQYDLWGFRLRVEAASSCRTAGGAGGGGGMPPLAAAFGVAPQGYAPAPVYQQPYVPVSSYGAPPPGPPPGAPDGGYGGGGGGFEQVGQKRARVGEPGGPEPTSVAEIDEALLSLQAQQAELAKQVASLEQKREALQAAQEAAHQQLQQHEQQHGDQADAPAADEAAEPTGEAEAAAEPTAEADEPPGTAADDEAA